MSIASYFTPLVTAFFSADTYRMARDRWPGLGLRYLLILQLVWSLAVGASIVRIGLHFFYDETPSGLEIISDASREMASQLPDMELRDGHLHVLDGEVHNIYLDFGEGEELIAVIDENATINDLQDSDSVLLITGEAFHGKKEDGTIETRFYSDLLTNMEPGEPLEPISITPSDAYDWIDIAEDWLKEHRSDIGLYSMIFIFCLFVTIGFIFRILQVMLFGLIGLLLNAIMRRDYPFEAIVRVACVAMTPAILLNIIGLWAMQQTLPGWGFLLLTVAYIVFGLRVRPAETSTENH